MTAPLTKDRNNKLKTPHDAADDADGSLVAQARQGDLSAITEIIESYQRRVFGICYRMVSHYDDAADLTQEALIKVLTNLDRFDGRAAFSTWVVRIAMNVSLSHLRKEKRRRATFQSTGKGDIGGPGGKSVGSGGNGQDQAQLREPAESSGVEQREETERLNDCLMKIGEEYRALLILRDIQGLGYRQIAEVLGIPIGTVKSRIFRARLAFRKVFERSEENSALNAQAESTNHSSANEDAAAEGRSLSDEMGDEVQVGEVNRFGSPPAKED